MTTTPSTHIARAKAKRIMASFRAKQIQIWKTINGFRVMTFERPGNSHASCDFPTKDEAFRHILARSANTGFDLARFDAIAARYFRRFMS